MTNTPESAVFPHGDITKRIIGCFLDVAHELGHGYSEAVLCRALIIALTQDGLNVRSEVPMKVHFRGTVIGTFVAGSRRGERHPAGGQGHRRD